MSLKTPWSWEHVLQDDENVGNKTKVNSGKKNRTGHLSFLWKSWLLCTYDYSEGSLVTCSELFWDAERVEDEMPGPIIPCILSRLINELWGKQVRHVRRGPRKDRVTYFENLKKRDEINMKPDLDISFEEICEEIMHLQMGWWMVMDRIDSASFIRHESWSFQSQRVFLEIAVSAISGTKSLSYILKAHGSEIDLDCLMDMKRVNAFPLKGMERINMILTFIEGCTVCKGVPIVQGEKLPTLIDYSCGRYCDLTQPPSEGNQQEFKAFAKDCAILCAKENICRNCSYLKGLSNKRAKRLLERTTIHPKTNKRYLIS